MRDRGVRQLETSLAAQTRGEADRVLHRLIDDRQMIERRLRETGRPDPLKLLTGRSALDRAITATRDIIDRMDSLLEELRTEATDAPEPASLGLAEAPIAPNGNGSATLRVPSPRPVTTAAT